MARLKWNESGSHLFETGADRGVFYPAVGPGIPWSGLLSVQSDSDGAETRTTYVDGVPKSAPGREAFTATVRALHSPAEFDDYDGTNGLLHKRARPEFGFTYRTLVGDELVGENRSYLIHVVYNATATPSPFSASSLNKTASPAIFEWKLTTRSRLIPGAHPAAHLIIDASIAYPGALKALEDALYGAEGSDPYLPSPQQLFDLVEPFSILLIIDHGDGTWTASGPDDVVYMLDDETFAIDWPSVRYLSDSEYEVRSL